MIQEPKPEVYSDWFDNGLSNKINLPYRNNFHTTDAKINFGSKLYNDKYIQSFQYNKDLTTKIAYNEIPKFDYGKHIKSITDAVKKKTTKIYDNKKLSLKQQNVKCKTLTTKYDKQYKNLNKIIKIS